MNTTQTTTTNGLPVLVWQEDDLFIAKTINMEIASQGTSRKEALNNLEEAVELYFQDEKLSSYKLSPLSNLQLSKINPKIAHA